MQEFEKMISGEVYDPMSEYLYNLRENTRNKLYRFNSEQNTIYRVDLLYSILGKIGDGCYITPAFYCDYGINIEFGDNVYLNTNCTILDSAKVTIGSNTIIGPNVQIYTPMHPIDYKTRNLGLENALAITIGKNCWIGGGAIILPGVKIGNGCVIGAGAVVTKNVPKNKVVAGNPAKIIRNIEQEKIVSIKQNEPSYMF